MSILPCAAADVVAEQLACKLVDEPGHVATV